MKQSGPDSLTSWIIAGSCCFINVMIFGMARLSGVLFVASVPRFNVSRKEASFPYAFASFVRNTSGPLVGYLGHKFGVRSVTAFGCLLSAIGAGTCFLAENIDTVTVLWGTVFGLGYGLSNNLLPVSINQYFDKLRTSALGLAFSGACLGSFILPPIVEELLNEYGLSGTFLFLSGFILNCVPAALLLKKPGFKIDNSHNQDLRKSERQSAVSEMKLKLDTVDDNSQKSLNSAKVDNKADVPPIIESAAVIRKDSYDEEVKSNLTYEERIKRLSTQTLLSEYSIRMSTSEPLDVDEIIGNSKGRRQVDPLVLEAEVLSLSSHNTDQDVNSEKDEVFEKDVRSSSVQYEIPPPAGSLHKTRTSLCESLIFNKETNSATNPTEGHHNYAYQTDSEVQNNTDFFPNFIAQNSIQKHTNIQPGNNEVYFNCSYQKNINNFSTLAEKNKSSPSNLAHHLKNSECAEIDNFKVRHGILSHPEKCIPKTEKKSSLGSFGIIFDPMFILIAVTNAIYCFCFVCMLTIIVDFARDLNIGISNEKYILMTLSVGDLVGRLGLGWITDYGYMSPTGFAAVCFACQGITTAAVVLCDGFNTLMIVVTLYGLSEAGIIIIYPVIIAQYIDKDKQTVAIPSSNFLSGPVCLAIAPLIGYFRDQTGAYDNIFYGIGILSAISCLCLILMPCISSRGRQ